jgi:hypothetical protein
VYTIALDGTTLYAGGSFSTIGGQPRNFLGAVELGTGLAPPWNPNPNSYVRSLFVSGGTVYVGGQFSQVGGQARGCLAAVDAVSGAVTPWKLDGAAASGPVIDGLAAQDQTLYAAGHMDTFGGRQHPNLAAITIPILDVPASRPTLALAITEIAPLPLHGEGRIRFTPPRAGNVSLEVYDVAGRKRTTLLKDTPRGAGPGEVELDAHGWPTGCYFARLELDDASVVRKLVVIR